jgi:hypothetical protein
MGFPGSTYRYLTTAEVQSRMEAQNEPRIIIRTVALEVLRQAMAVSDKTRIQYAATHAGISNYWKNSIGMNEAIVNNNVLGVKAEQERNYEAFAQGKPEYQGVVKKLNDIITAEMPYRRQTQFLSEAFRNVIQFIGRNVSTANLTAALEAKDEAGIQKGLERLQAIYNTIHNKDYDHNVDRAVAKAVLPVYAENIPAEQRPAFYQTIDKEYKGNTDAYVDALYDKSILANEANLNKFLKKPTVKALQRDLMLQFTAAVAEKSQELSKALAENTQEVALLHKAYIRGLGEMKLPTPSYPDANFTIRLTYGNVKPYQPRDGVTYKYYTTTDGVLEKEDPTNREFNVPAKLKQLIQAKDFGRYAMKNGEMPVCFLSTNDITGGNSGSPVLNANGELIGAAFDGNWESLSGDISFNKELQRCINVDIRYVLFIIEKLGNCRRLIDEMTIVE